VWGGGCPNDAVAGGFLCEEHAQQQVLKRLAHQQEDFVAFRARGLERSRLTIPAQFRDLNLGSGRLPRLLSPETWKRSQAHAERRAYRLISTARAELSFVVRGPLHAGGTALACAALGSVLAAYEHAAPNSAAATLGNQAVYLSAGAVVRARLASPRIDGGAQADPPDVDAFAHAGFLVVDGLGTEARADRISDLLAERICAGTPFVVGTNLTRAEAKHRYGDVGEALFALPVLDLTPSMVSVPTEYAWSHLDSPLLLNRVGPMVDGQRAQAAALIEEARSVVDEMDAGERLVVMLVGPSRAGKTSLAVAIGTELVERDLSKTFLFADAFELQEEEGRRFGGAQAESALLSDARTVDVLVLDEVGAEKPPRDKASVVAELLHHRHKHHLKTIITTPHRSKVLKGLYGDGIFRRIAAQDRTRYIVLGSLQEKKNAGVSDGGE
jgi:hypothetical protein